MFWLKKSKVHRITLRILACCFACLFLVMAFTPLPALASKKKPSAENCRGLGDSPVKCFARDTKQYKGLVSVLGEFDVTSSDCFRRYQEARGKCSRAYDIPKHNVCMVMVYKLGTTTYTTKCPKDCDK